MYRKFIDYNPDLERSVLGIFMLIPAAFGSCYNLLSEDCFYLQSYKDVYKAIKRVYDKGYPIDLITVSQDFYQREVMQIDGYHSGYFLTQMVMDVVNDAHLEVWCLMLRELAARRLMVEMTSSGFKSDDVLDGAKDIENRLKKILDVRVSNDWLDGSQVALRLTKRMEEKEAVKGIMLPFSDINRLNGGFRPGNMIVLGARPSAGKSALAGQIGIFAARQGYKVGIISLEMGNEDVLARLAAAESQVDFYKIDRNILREQIEQKTVMNTLATISSLPIYFSDKAQVNIHDIRAKADKLKKKHGLDFLIIDYLQLIEPESSKNTNREQEISKISRGIKMMAMSGGYPVLILAQLNREAADKEPELHHLRESGSIEQDADIVMFIHREKDESGAPGERAKLLVRKWRNGTPMQIELKFHKEIMRFTQYDDIVKPESNPYAGMPKTNDKTPF